MTLKRKQHKVTPIGMDAAQRYVKEQRTAKRKGAPMGDKTARTLTLVLAYGLDTAAANLAANNDTTRDQSAAHQLKWKAITNIKKLIKLGLVEKVVEKGFIDKSDFAAIAADLKFIKGCTDQEVAAVKAVACYGATVEDVESFCELSIQKLVDTAKTLSGK